MKQFAKALALILLMLCFWLVMEGRKYNQLDKQYKVWYHVAVIEKGHVIFERVVAEVAIRCDDIRIDLKDDNFPTTHYSLIAPNDLAVHYKEPVFPLFPSDKENDNWEVCSFGMAVQLKIDKTHIRDWAEKK